MTCIVGLVEGDRIHMAGDSAAVAGLDVDVYQEPKVGRVGRYVFGYTSSFRMGQLLLNAFTPPEPGGDLVRFMVRAFVPAWMACLKSADVKPGSFLVGVSGRLFAVHDDYQVGESRHGFAAVGCGAAYALGSMVSTEGQPPHVRLMTALRAAVEFNGGVRPPFSYVVT